MSERSRWRYAVIMLREGIATLTTLFMALPLPSDFLLLSVLPVSFHPFVCLPSFLWFSPYFFHPHWPQDKEYLSTALTLHWTSTLQWHFRRELILPCLCEKAHWLEKFVVVSWVLFYCPLSHAGFSCWWNWAWFIASVRAEKIQSGTSLFRSQSKQPQCKDHSKCSTLLHRDIDQHVHLCCCTICSMGLYRKRENKQRKLSLAQMLPYVPRSYGNSPAVRFCKLSNFVKAALPNVKQGFFCFAISQLI